MSEYTFEARLPEYAIDDKEHVKHLLHGLRRQAADKLLETIHYSRYYSIRVDEEWPDYFEQERARAGNGYYVPNAQAPWDEGLRYRLVFTVMPIEEHTYEIATYTGPDYSEMGAWPLTTSAVSEIKRRIKSKWRRLTGRNKGLSEQLAKVFEEHYD